MLLLPANLAPLSKLCAKESTRWAVNAVHVTATDEGYIAQATDSRFAGRVTGETVADVDCFPHIPALAAAPNGAKQGLIASADWAAAFRALPKGKTVAAKPILGNLACQLSEKEATLASTDLASANVKGALLVEGRFPPLAELLDKAGRPQLAIDLDAAKMAELLAVAAGFAGDTKEGRVTIELRWDVKEKASTREFRPVIVRTQNTGQKFEGLLMPLSGGKPVFPDVAAPVAVEEPQPVAPPVPATVDPLAALAPEALDVCARLAALCFDPPDAQRGNLLSLAECARMVTVKAASLDRATSIVVRHDEANAQDEASSKDFPARVAREEMESLARLQHAAAPVNPARPPAPAAPVAAPPAPKGKRVKAACTHPPHARIKVQGTPMCKLCCSYVNPADKARDRAAQAADRSA